MSEVPLDTPEWHDDTVEQFRANGGTVQYYGRILVLLHHRGAHSGTERVTPVVGIADGDDWLVAASRRGAAENPAWFYNLLAHPDVKIETPDHGTVEILAIELTADARDEGWTRFTALSPVFAQYQAQTTRVIPVLRLTRR
jgi:deazaflavin-dependent oxidoreductase (nitroreductase family)